MEPSSHRSVHCLRISSLGYLLCNILAIASILIPSSEPPTDVIACKIASLAPLLTVVFVILCLPKFP
jgi:hypothetical protein